MANVPKPHQVLKVKTFKRKGGHHANQSTRRRYGSKMLRWREKTSAFPFVTNNLPIVIIALSSPAPLDKSASVRTFLYRFIDAKSRSPYTQRAHARPSLCCAAGVASLSGRERGTRGLEIGPSLPSRRARAQVAPPARPDGTPRAAGERRVCASSPRNESGSRGESRRIFSATRFFKSVC